MFRVEELLFINQTILLTLQKRGARTAVDNFDIVNIPEYHQIINS